MAKTPVNPQSNVESGDGPWAGAPARELGGDKRVLNVPPDIFDIRDRSYQPRLCPLPSQIDGRNRVPKILDQHSEGACTGFALAGMANFLFGAQEKELLASPRFLYENARRYDEWKGEEYEGSSLRGAMKGFLKHGVCREETLPYVSGEKFFRLPEAALAEAGNYPIGAYYRIATGSINDLQCAICETGAVAASACVHSGWNNPKPVKGLATIEVSSTPKLLGGHAFLLIGFNDDGFLIQNSWGTSWGSEGFAILRYEDWLRHRMDAWVAQLGVGQVADYEPRLALSGDAGVLATIGPPEEVIHGHYLAVEDGKFDEHGTYRSSESDLPGIAGRIRAFGAQHGGTAKVMISLHGGLNDEDGAARKALDFLQKMTPQGIYPIHLLWHTGFLETLEDVVSRKAEGDQAALPQRAGSLWNSITEKLQNAADEALELFARIPGRALWRDMKNDAAIAVRRNGNPGPVWKLLDAIRGQGGPVEYHLVGHSAGAVFAAHLLDWFESRGETVSSISFLAPAISLEQFKSRVRPRVDDGTVSRFGIHLMRDADERDDNCAHVYHKSLLYFVTNSFEEDVPTPLLGLARNIDKDWKGGTKSVDQDVKTWLEDNQPRVEVRFRKPVLNTPGGSLHGAFDDDPVTISTIIQRIKA